MMDVFLNVKLNSVLFPHNQFGFPSSNRHFMCTSASDNETKEL